MVSQEEFLTCWGRVQVVWTEKGISWLSLPGEKIPDFKAAGKDQPGKIQEEIEGYFQGKLKTFSLDPDFSGLTAFQQKVYWAAMNIPYGETRSYKWVAEKAGSQGYQAVGQALGRNPVPLIVP